MLLVSDHVECLTQVDGITIHQGLAIDRKFAMFTRVRRSLLLVYIAAGILFTLSIVAYYRPRANMLRILNDATSSKDLIITLPDKPIARRKAFYGNLTGNTIGGVFVLVDIMKGEDNLTNSQGVVNMKQLTDKEFGFGNCDEVY